MQTKASVSWSTGFIMLLLGAVGIFAQMESAFARIWKEDLPQPKPGIWPLIQRLLLGRLKAFIVVLGLGTFMVLTFLSSFIISGAATFLDNIEEIGWVHDTWEAMPLWLQELPIGTWTLRALQFGVGVTLNLLLFLFLYRLFCPRRIGWSACIRGSLVASLLWELGRLGLTCICCAVVTRRTRHWLVYRDHALVLLRVERDALWRGMGRGFLAAARSSLQSRQRPKRNELRRATRPARAAPSTGDCWYRVEHPPGYEPLGPNVDPEDRPENR